MNNTYWVGLIVQYQPLLTTPNSFIDIWDQSQQKLWEFFFIAHFFISRTFLVTEIQPFHNINTVVDPVLTAVMVLKPKTAVLRRNRTATEPWFSGGHMTVFLEFKKWPSPAQSQMSPNNSLIIASAGLPPALFEVTDWPTRVELPDSKITCYDTSTFALLSAPSRLTLYIQVLCVPKSHVRCL